MSLSVRRNRLQQFERKYDADWVKQCMLTDGTRQRGCPKTTWWDCIKGDIMSCGLSCEDAQDGISGD